MSRLVRGWRRLGVGGAARGWARVAAVLATGLAWPAQSPAPTGEQLPKGGAACFAGDLGCRNDAFTLAAALLAADGVAHVVVGRVVAAPGLPETLGERRVVEARFEVRHVRKPPGSCPYPVRLSVSGDRCDEAPMPRHLTLRIPSDWFLWPAAGTSRRVARLAGGRVARLGDLERELAAGRIDEWEYRQGRTQMVREALAAVGDDGPRAAVRLLEDRALHVEVGVEYLFALGPQRRGADGPYHLPASPEVNAEWHFFAGGERVDVDIALRGIGNCLIETEAFQEAGLLDPPTIDDCMILARGAATYTHQHPHMRRH